MIDNADFLRKIASPIGENPRVTSQITNFLSECFGIGKIDNNFS